MRKSLLLLATLAAGCTSQWYPGVSHHDIARTDVVISSEPAGASLEFDGKKLEAPAPVRLPVEYTHTETQYERQSNYGISMRKDMSTPVAILTFPIWAVASLFHYKEQLRRHDYGGNVHVITAFVHGYDEGREEIKLEGEAEKVVTFKLVKSR
jgi:hypothetical protein